MRRLLLVCCTCLACTRENPAFDETLTSAESETRGSTDTSADTSEAEADTSEAETDTSPDDLPDEPACEFQPSQGLALRFTDPEFFSGTCPNGVDVLAKINSAAGGEATFSVCGEGCTGCAGEHQLSAFPMIITDYLPQGLDGCVVLQAANLFGQESSSCVWGAISVHDPLTGSPYVIATTHSSAPTPFATEVLGDLIPAPAKAGNCNCDDVGQGNDCCYQAEGPPEFWYYPYEGTDLYPGDYAPLTLANQAATQHYFKVYQAERLHSCESHDLQLSWAVIADL